MSKLVDSKKSYRGRDRGEEERRGEERSEGGRDGGNEATVLVY